MATLVYIIVCNNFLEGFLNIRGSKYWKWNGEALTETGLQMDWKLEGSKQRNKNLPGCSECWQLKHKVYILDPGVHAWGFLKTILDKNKKSITRVIMNLFCYDRAIVICH